MKAHVIHDARGTIKSVVFQSTELEGELKITSDGRGDVVTTVELDEEAAPGRTRADLSDQHLSELGRKIRTGFRVDKDRRTLEKLRA